MNNLWKLANTHRVSSDLVSQGLRSFRKRLRNFPRNRFSLKFDLKYETTFIKCQDWRYRFNNLRISRSLLHFILRRLSRSMNFSRALTEMCTVIWNPSILGAELHQNLQCLRKIEVSFFKFNNSRILKHCTARSVAGDEFFFNPD